MSTQKQQNGNGLAGAKPATEPSKTTSVTTPTAQEKPKEAILKNLPAVIDLPPLDDRLYRLDQLFELRKQHSKLQDSLQKLNAFQIKADSETSSLTLRDDVRNDFATYHPIIIEEVVEFLKEKIKAKIKAIEPKLTW